MHVDSNSVVWLEGVYVGSLTYMIFMHLLLPMLLECRWVPQKPSPPCTACSISTGLYVACDYTSRTCVKLASQIIPQLVHCEIIDTSSGSLIAGSAAYIQLAATKLTNSSRHRQVVTSV